MARFAVAAMLVLMGAMPALPAESLIALQQQVARLYGQGRYDEAATVAGKALELAERTLGPNHVDTLRVLNDMGLSYCMQGRFAEAEVALKRGVAGMQQVLGAEHPDTLTSVNSLAMTYHGQGRYGEAETLYRQALDGRERKLGAQHQTTLVSVNNLAFLYHAQGRYSEAEQLLTRALAGIERTLGPAQPDTLMIVNNLAVTYQLQGRYGEAEPLYKRALAGRQQALGPEHPFTLTTITGLAGLYQGQGRFEEAETLYRGALATRERKLGPEHFETLANVNDLGLLLWAQERYDEAEPLFRRAEAGLSKALGPEHPLTLTAISNLGAIYQKKGNYAEAVALEERVLASKEKILGPDHPDTIISVNNLGYTYQLQGRYGEAEPLLKRALASFERNMGPEHTNTITSISNMGMMYMLQSEWQKSVPFWRRATAIITQRTLRGAKAAEQSLTAKMKSEVEQSTGHFPILLKVGYRLGPQGTPPDAAITREMFEAAQWAMSSQAAQSLAQMAARGAKGDGALASLVRERQDLVAEWQRREQMRNAALGQEAGKRDAKGEEENTARMSAIDARIAAVDKRLAAEFPDYASLASPAPLTVEDVQAQLGADEALVLFVDTKEWKPTPEETFVWVVTKTAVRWVRSDLGKAALAREVAALRCGLDAVAWSDKRCAELTGAQYAHADYLAGKPLPFDMARAHRLYRALLGQVEDLIEGKRLLVVASGALTQLPFQMLLTAPPAPAGDYRSAPWLMRRHALTVLPAVSSLKALRATSRPSAATRPLIGFGNPLLDGSDARDVKLASLAREKQRCPDTTWQRMAGLFTSAGGLAPVAVRGGHIDVAEIRQQTPLPETADELCAVARDVGADVSELRLGARATETGVKALSESGKLAQFRILHFATHGAMAGDLTSTSEPGLVLTPPGAPSEADDGYLSASEIAALKLDADWVILSACNTAAASAPNAEALSGLARAFIYAQARALLVSHWAVNSSATVKLITASMREIARDRKVGRAEALRRAMLALADKGEPYEAHPAIWAPFIVVGDGRR